MIHWDRYDIQLAETRHRLFAANIFLWPKSTSSPINIKLTAFTVPNEFRFQRAQHSHETMVKRRANKCTRAEFKVTLHIDFLLIWHNFACFQPRPQVIPRPKTIDHNRFWTVLDEIFPMIYDTCPALIGIDMGFNWQKPDAHDLPQTRSYVQNQSRPQKTLN